MLPEIYAGCAERGNPDMAIFHYTIKIVGRSKGKSVISASAYLNGDVMKNEETGRISYYTSKKEVVYTRLMMCENAPPEWQIVPEENIKRFQKSVRYKRSEDKEAALEKFNPTDCKAEGNHTNFCPKGYKAVSSIIPSTQNDLQYTVVKE